MKATIMSEKGQLYIRVEDADGELVDNIIVDEVEDKRS